VATDAAANEGCRLGQGLLDSSNTASGVRTDTAYRSAANEIFLNKYGFVSHHRKKPKGRAIPETMRRANNAKTKIRARVEHVFAEQKGRMRLFIRTIGKAVSVVEAMPSQFLDLGLVFSSFVSFILRRSVSLGLETHHLSQTKFWYSPVYQDQ
jgi:hypothetical protein